MAEEQIITFIAKCGERVEMAAALLEKYSQTFADMAANTEGRDSFEIQTDYSSAALCIVRDIIYGRKYNIHENNIAELALFSEQYEMYCVYIALTRLYNFNLILIDDPII